jgi:hypothetical protein
MYNGLRLVNKIVLLYLEYHLIDAILFLGCNPSILYLNRIMRTLELLSQNFKSQNLFSLFRFHK